MHYSNIPPGRSHVLMGFLGAGKLTDTRIKQSQCICSQNNGPILSDSAYQLVSLHHDTLLKTLALILVSGLDSCISPLALHILASHMKHPT